MIKRISIVLCTILCFIGLASCKPREQHTDKPIKHKIIYVLDGGTNSDFNPDEFVEGTEIELFDPTKPGYTFLGWFIGETKVTSIPKTQKSDVTLTAKWQLSIKPNPTGQIAISGPSSMDSGTTVQLTATVKDLPAGADQSVTWSIETGSEYAIITVDGKLTALSVQKTQTIVVKAVSNYSELIYGTFTIKIKPEEADPVLTQDMLDALKVEKISFDGYVKISLYTIGMFSKLDRTTEYTVQTAMDGTNWYAQYENSTTVEPIGLYIQNHENIACQVGLTLMNEELFEPMLDNNGKPISWIDSGYYNNFMDLKVSDFKLNSETKRFDYVGADDKLAERMISSANPYSFIANGFSLIIDDGEIIGIYAKSGDDYTIAEGYRAIQELIATVNYYDDVEVPTIPKYGFDEEIHTPLKEAIENMRNLNSYTVDFRELTQSIYSSSLSLSGYMEYITNDNLYYNPFTFEYLASGDVQKTFRKNSSYGYKKISDSLYNAYFQEDNGLYYASRAYEDDVKVTRPSFMFAAEIFRSYYPDADGSMTYYVDDLMSYVATTFYHGVGNDINLYGIFATRGYISQTSSFTPYVVVKDGYITNACFYYNMGLMSGVIEITYSNFNDTTLPNDVNVDFETRYVPTSWKDHLIYDDNVEFDAPEFLKAFFEDEDILEKMPLFERALGDTYAFGYKNIRTIGGRTEDNSAIVKTVIQFYYDVPLDNDYSIASSIKKVEAYLFSLGFEKNQYGEFYKGDLYVYPADVELDLMIYVWKA